ncbi:MAG: hypothetical protein QOJ16_1558, partial [Acidobacteriota bacterium]|nr:hypothetical protein [Acidobacteriota bacterium]
LAERLTALGQGSQATLFMVLLAGFAALLGRLSGSEDLVVGSPVANRQRAEVEGLIGFFVNTLPLRVDLAGEPGFRALLDRVREVTLGAYAHQDVPFEKLVEALSPERSLAHSPLFQVLLVLQNAPLPPLELPGLILTPLPLAEGTAKFDLTLSLAPRAAGAGVEGTLEYNRDLFDRTTAERLAGGFVRLLEAAAAAPETRLPDLPLPGEIALLARVAPPVQARGAERLAATAPMAPTAPRTPLEARLAAIWSEVLGRERVGIADDFFASGGHSLLATRLVSRVRQALGVDLPLRAIFEAPTVAALAARLQPHLQTPPSSQPRLVPVPRKGDPPLSFAQERLWFLDQLDPGSASYNMAGGVRLNGSLSVAAMAAALSALAARHEALRTTFRSGAEGPVQVIAPAARFALPLVDLAGLPPSPRAALARRLSEEETARPFDLAAGPLARVCLLELSAGEDGEHVLLLTLHHIIADGWSLAVFVHELTVFYGAALAGRLAPLSPLPPLPIQYADFALWQRSWLSGAELERQLAWWREHLAGAPALLELPADRPRPAVQSFRGGTVPVVLPAGLAERLTVLGHGSQATLFMVLLAGFAAFLGRLSGSEDLVVGSPVANRQRAELEGLIGFFVNTLPLRADLSGEPGFRGLLDRLREVTLSAYAHQDVPFEKLVEELAPERSLGHTPLFQAVLALQTAPVAALELPGLELAPLPAVEGVAKFDLTLTLVPGTPEMAGTLEYNRDLFDRTTARRFADSFVRLLAAAVETPEARLGELPLLSPGERAQILHEWNDTVTAVPGVGALVHERFAAWARRAPAALAVAAPDGRLTYGDLASQAARLARRLRGLGVGPEVRVALCAGLSPLRVVGILAVLQAGGAYVPLDPDSPPARLGFLLADCGAAVLLAERRFASRLPASPLATLYLDDDSPEPEAATAAARPVLPADLAYVVYTSGSTGVPKGVAVPHSGLLNLVLWHQERYGVTPEDRATQIASPAFDASVWELWPYLAAGASVHIPPEEIRLSPPELADWWEREGITWSFLPTPLAESVLAEGWGERRPGLRLRGLLCGGDRLHRAPAAGLPFPLLNHYGPSEYSVVTTAAAVPPETAGLPPIGRPIANTRAVVLDAWGALAPLGVAGELAIGGAGLARGYLGRPELTAERFVPDPWSNEPGARLYRTGDLIRRLPNGSLDFLGRIDHQVKVRGFRIELGEIESALRGEPEVREAAVLVREDRPGDRRLVAYVALAMDGEEERSAAVRALRQALERRLPAYMVPNAFVVLEALPLSGNGKVDRRALASRPPEEGPGDAVAVAPRTALEARLAEIWAAVLGREKVGVLDDFFASGGHSLLATRLVSRIREALGVELPLRAVFEAPTVAALAARLGDGFDDSGLAAPLIQPLPPAAREGGLPLSFAQERLWFLDQLEPGSASYNIPGAVRLEGKLSVAALAVAFSSIVLRHEALRTTFRPGSAGPLQVIAPLAGAGLPLPLVDLAGLPAAARDEAAGRLLAEEAGRPFDLARGPLLRSTLLRLAPERHLAVLNLHHIVADGWSMDVFVRELAAFYGAALEGRPAPLAPLPVQYADFAVWQRGWLAGPEIERQLDWWRQRLAGVPTTLELPADRPRPPVLSPRGGAVPLALSQETAAGLTALARAAEATPFMVLFAGFSALLARYTGQEDLLVGSPVANRTRSEVEGLIGLFVNTLALRAELGGRPPFRDLVSRAREMALGAYAHQDLPFERLVEELQPARDLSRSPLFQVLLVLQNNPASPFVLPGLTLEPAEVDAGVTKFDLQLTLFETGGAIAGTLTYAADLFDRATAERMTGHLATLLAGAAADPGRTLAELPLLSAAERAQLAAWNATETASPEGERTLPELFARQAAATPDAVAAVSAGEALTYAALAARAAGLTARLQGLGVGPEKVVGLCAERSLDMIVALLGILGAGGAYLPLDPSYPAERLAAILADAQVPVILAQERLLDRLPAHAADLVLLDGETGRAAAPVTAPGVVPDDLAYVIFTSGSTGRPKGVMNSHRGIVNRILWMQEQYGLTPADRVLQKTPYSFDVSVWEFFWPLLTGARLVFAQPGGHQDSAYLVRTIAEEGITVTHFVPSMLAAFLAEPDVPRCSSLAQVMASGEALPPELAQRFFGRLGARLHNLYGPTEAAVDVTFWECEREPMALIPPGVPIGRPVANTGIHLFDPEGTPVPVGVPGELGIGGVQVARGYAGRPDLTAERFVPDPFSPLPGGRLYRTGDLARRRPGGEVEYLGRLDHQVKLRGLRIELGEIESVLAAHPGVLAAAVVVREARPGDPRLVAYVVGRGAEAPETADLRAHLLARLPEYMVPALFIHLDTLPLTPSGKTDRRALPAPDWRGEGRGESAEVPLLGTLAPIEEIVALLWAEVLGLPESERIAPGDSFFELGGHSLLATQVVSRLREAFGVELPLRRLFERPTVAGLAAAVEEARTALATGREVPLPPIVRGQRPADLPLSFAQERLWLLDQLEPGSFAYNLPTALRLRGEVDVAALGASLGEIVRRHESLRTRFVARGGKPVQVILAPAPFPVPVVDLAGIGAARAGESAVLAALAEDDARRPFDLAAGPLFRVTLLRLAGEDGESLLLLNLHHIISDGWSVGVFVRELAALYTAARLGQPSPLPELPVQAADFALWQRRQLGGDLLAGQIAWWRERLAGAPTLLELPADRPRPQVRRSRGAHHPFTLPAPLAAEVRTFSRRTGATPFMTLLAAFQALLARYTGERDLLVGSPVAGRTQREIEGLIGFFVNTLVLRLDLGGQPGFRTLVERARESALGAYDHQELPFERLVEALQPERHLSHTPFFQVLFALQNAPLGKLELPGLALEPVAVESGIAKFDLTLGLREAGEVLTGVLEYDRDLFEAVTAARIVSHFETLLAGALADPRLGLAELPLLSAAERQQARVEWNEPRVDYPDHGLLPGLLAAVAARRPDAVALCFAGEQVSHGELAARAGGIARHLRALGLAPESRVGIAVERSPAMVAALLGVWEAGGAYLPLDPALPAERLSYMLADAGVAAILADRGTAAALPALPGITVPLLAIEDLWAGEPEGPVHAPFPLVPEQAAYLLYTSGSTGKPKGVAVSHAALGNRIRYVEAAEVAAADRFLHKTTLLFDASIGEIFSPLLAGATMVLAVPGEERDPSRLIALVEREEVTLASFTASMLAALLEERSLERCRGLRAVFTGAEVVPPELATRFYAQSPADLYNRYGPTETTISVLAWHCLRGESGRALPIGRPIARTEAYVLDFEGAALPAGVAGELCLGGPCLARGYHDRPDLTAEKFVPHPSPAAPGERLYRTGDLARFRLDGAVEFLGRIDSQVKIRGLRIELGEIEAGIAEHPAVERAVVVDRDEEGTGKRLVAYYVQRQGMAVGPRELAGLLREKMPDYMVPSAWGVLDALPLTVTGKVDRRALPEPEQLEAAEEGEAARGPVEELLAGIWADLLDVRQVRRRDSFFGLGGHSLLATQVISRVRESLAVELPLRALFQAPTLAGFAAAIESARRETGPSSAPAIVAILPASRPRSAFPLSFAQERLWFLDQLLPGSALYNIPGAMRFSGRLVPALLRGALAGVVDRHEALRTTFAAVEDGAVQRIAPAGAVAATALPEVDLRGLQAFGDRSEAELARLAAAEARRPFNLTAGPLLRVTLVRIGDEDNVVLFTLHHIVGDGWSMGIFVRELAAFYGALAAGESPTLPALPIQYADFALWQREWLPGVLPEEVAWWRERLAGAPAVLELPTDRPRPAVQRYRGGQLPFKLPAEPSAEIERLSRRLGATPFMLLLAAFATLLGRSSGQDEVVVGSPIANRNRAETEGLIGLFVNTLALRAGLADDPSFAALLARVREGTLAAYAHQDLPFEKLVEALQPERSLAHSPLFQVFLILQNTPQGRLRLPDLDVEPVPVEAGAAKFDLTLALGSSAAGLTGAWEYDRDLFDEVTVARMAGWFASLLAALAADPADAGAAVAARISELPLLSAPERQQLREWSFGGNLAGSSEKVPEACLHDLFLIQAARTPAAEALIWGEERLTYRELASRVERLAGALVGLGVGPEMRVGVCLARTAALPVALLAVLQAGGAYVPLDPQYPRERLKLMLEDSRAHLLLTQPDLEDRLPEAACPRLFLTPAGLLDGELPRREGQEGGAATPENLAYLIYTSGSTGQPKGVAIEHRSAVTLALWARQAFSAAELSGVLFATSVCFDLSVFELFVPLAWGGRVIVAENALALAGLAAAGEVTLVNTVPSAMAELVRQGALPPSVRTVNLAGEPLPLALVEALYDTRTVERVWNLYGPSEDTTYSTFARQERGAPGPLRPPRQPDIGRPIAGTQAHVLDRAGRPVPAGVAGELYLGGAGLARGYLERPDLTAERFLPDPFAEAPGGRLYRTGDLARARSTGELHFLGRIDHQVKVRGFRIELGEIEALLGRHPGVREAVVLAREDRPGDRRLVAYVVGAGGPPPPIEELRAHLKEGLPEYMVPTAFVPLAALPLSPNGKVDRKALPAPERTAQEEKVAPRTPWEQRIAGIFSEVLGVERVGV